MFLLFFFQAEDGIRDAQESRGLGDVYKRQTLDRDKISPNGEQEGKDIRYVPTLIVSKDNQEIGRIVESPSSETATLESDLFEISLGIPPVPNYSDTE